MGIFLGLSLSHCAHWKASSVKIAWYVASKTPYTFCPVGHRLPSSGSAEAKHAEYVYLADRSARFYIPRGLSSEKMLKQALAVRLASFSPSERHKIDRLRNLDLLGEGVVTVFYLAGTAVVFGGRLLWEIGAGSGWGG